MADAFDALREFVFDDRPLVVEVDRPLHPANQRLMDSLGVEVRIVTSTAQLRQGRATVGHTEGNYVLPGPTFAKPSGPRVDIIDHRASLANVARRVKAGEVEAEMETCAGCGTELDVDVPAHSPRCKTIAPMLPRATAADWDHDSVVAALCAHATDGVAPAGSSWYSRADGRPTYAIVCRVFGTWAQAIEASGLTRAKPGRRRKRTADADEHEAAAAELRDLHARRENDEDELPVTAASGSPVEADETTAGEDESPGAAATEAAPDIVGARWTRELIVEAIQRFERENGRAPTQRDWPRRGEWWPAFSTAAKHFGGWGAALDAAGVTRSARSRQGATGGRHHTVDERQQPPVVWAVKVPGTGLRYRTVDEALVAADEIEHDGERVAREARVQGDEGKADQAVDASRELAEKIRAAASGEATSEERVTRRTVGAGRGPRSSDAEPEIDTAAIREKVLVTVNSLFALLDEIESQLKAASA